MNITFQQTVFIIVSLLIITGAVAAVTAKHILRAVTALLMVLFGTAAFYFMLDYTFLGVVQIKATQRQTHSHTGDHSCGFRSHTMVVVHSRICR